MLTCASTVSESSVADCQRILFVSTTNFSLTTVRSASLYGQGRPKEHVPVMRVKAAQVRCSDVPVTIYSHRLNRRTILEYA